MSELTLSIDTNIPDFGDAQRVFTFGFPEIIFSICDPIIHRENLDLVINKEDSSTCWGDGIFIDNFMINYSSLVNKICFSLKVPQAKIGERAMILGYNDITGHELSISIIYENGIKAIKELYAYLETNDLFYKD